MKIIFLPSLSNSYGGPVVSTINLIKVVGDSSTLLITNNLGNHKFNDSLLPKVKIITSKKFLFSGYIFRFIKSKKSNYIFVNGCWDAFGMFLIILGIVFKKKLFLHPRGMLYPWSVKKNFLTKKIFIRFFYKYVHNHIEKVFCSSKDEQFFLKEFLPNAKTLILPNYQKFEKDSKRIKDNLFSKKLLFLSRIHEKKGINLLLDAWENYNPKGWELIICGPIDKNIKKNFLKKLNQLKDKNISYIGEVSLTKRFSIFKSCSVFILPTFQENFGNAILEALHSGLPVITTKNTPWSAIEKNFCGKIINTNSGSIIEAFYWLDSLNKRQIEKMSQNAFNLAENFNLDNYKDEIMKAFD